MDTDISTPAALLSSVVHDRDWRSWATMERMKPLARFSSFEEAEKADLEFYRSLTPQQRIELLLEMLEFVWPEKDGVPPRLERVYRIAEFSRR